MLTGEMLIGTQRVRGGEGAFRAIDPATNEALEPEFHYGGTDEVDRAALLAQDAFDVYRATSPDDRARFLDAIADRIEAIGPALIERGRAETGLPVARLESERGRTTGQLRLFASHLRSGLTEGVRIDPALPGVRGITHQSQTARPSPVSTSASG